LYFFRKIAFDSATITDWVCSMTQPPTDTDPPTPAQSTPRHDHSLYLLVAALLLAVMFGLAVGSALDKSPTFDEGFYVGRGWAFWRTGHLMPLGHPPLTNLLSGLGVLLEPGLPDPTTLNGWAEDNYEDFSHDLLWEQGIDTDRVIFLARLPTIFLGLLLGALVCRWGWELYGHWGALIALALYALSPNVLAHTRLATTDLGVAAFYVAALYAWTRFLRRWSARWLVIGGLLFGLAQAAKFSALLLGPTLLAMTLWVAWRKRKQLGEGDGPLAQIARWPLGWLWAALAALIGMGLIGLVALWATYLFALRPYPLANYVSEFLHFMSLAAEGHRAYLLGSFSQSGWWYYHPLILLAKMPLPALAILLVAITLALGRSMRPAEMALVFPALVYLGASMLGSLNVGIRYLLPMLPLLFLFSGRIASGSSRSRWLRMGVLAILLGCQAALHVWIYPDYLAFYNLAVGGPRNGYRIAVDSNLDWGQDLPELAAYLAGHDDQLQVYLSYFGWADPAYYGIDAIRLPGWPPPEPDPVRAPFHPLTPLPGRYAISASNLVGVQLYEPDSFAYFRTREPVARIGNSIFIYEIHPATALASARTRPEWFAQCATPGPLESEGRIADLTGIPDLRQIYFDCQQSLPFPAGPGWLMLPAEGQPVVDLGPPDYVARHADGSPRYRVWQVDGPPPPPPSTVEFPPLALPLPIAGYLELNGYQVSAGQVAPGETLTVTIWWRVREPPPPPVSFFAHLIAPDGTVAAIGDSLGVAIEDWQPGTVLIQQHAFNIGEEIPDGSYALAVGLYKLDTLERFPVSQSGERVVDRIVLRNVTVAR
jgi:hypothetical protein